MSYASVLACVTPLVDRARAHNALGAGFFAVENSRDAIIDQAQNQGIKAVRSGARRDDHDQHEGIKGLGEIEPIVDPVRFINRLVDFNSLRPRRGDGDEDDCKEAKRGERRKESDDHSGAGGKLDCWHPPLVKAYCRNAESLEFADDRTMALCVAAIRSIDGKLTDGVFSSRSMRVTLPKCAAEMVPCQKKDYRTGKQGTFTGFTVVDGVVTELEDLGRMPDDPSFQGR